MKIVVVGCGKVGSVLIKQLSQEGHEIVAVDRSAKVLRTLQEKCDVAIVEGNGASANILREAGTSDADLLIAVTPGDEVNLLCCMVARKLGCVRMIARVRDPEYDEEMGMLKKDLGLAFTINPEKAAAMEIFRLLQFPSFLKRDSFAGGRAETVELKLPESSKFEGKRLDQLADQRQSFLICAVERGGVVSIPSGSFELKSGDKLTVAASTAGLPELIRWFGISSYRIRHIMLIGGGTISAYLAKQLVRAGSSVTVIESSAERCEVLSEIIPEANIINGDGTEQSLLLDEGMADADAVVTLTGMDEENLLVSMFANHIGVPKTITKIHRLEYNEVFTDMGIDTIVSPKLLTANEIVRFVRAVGATREGSVEMLYRIAGGHVEALGFTAPAVGAFLGVPLHKLSIRKNILIASIVRGRRVIIPGGGDCMEPNDSVIVAADADMAISSLSEIFA